MRTRTTTGFKLRFGVVAALARAVALMSVAAVALAKTRHSASKTVTLPAKSTKTINVGYPAAKKYSGETYSCAFKVTGLGRKNVKILSHGSALGGTVCRVKAQNKAKIPSIDTTAKIKVTATSVY